MSPKNFAYVKVGNVGKISKKFWNFENWFIAKLMCLSFCPAESRDFL